MATLLTSSSFYMLTSSQKNSRWWYVNFHGSSEDEVRVFDGNMPSSYCPKFKIIAGSIPVDFLPNTIGYPIVSEKLFNILNKCHISGYRPFSASILSKHNRVLKEKYFALGILGNGGPIDEKKSKIKRKAFDSGEVVTKIEGIYFSEKTWDKSDIFFLQGFNGVIVTKRFVQILESNKIEGWDAVATPDYRYPFEV